MSHHAEKSREFLPTHGLVDRPWNWSLLDTFYVLHGLSCHWQSQGSASAFSSRQGRNGPFIWWSSWNDMNNWLLLPPLASLSSSSLATSLLAAPTWESMGPFTFTDRVTLHLSRASPSLQDVEGLIVETSSAGMLWKRSQTAVEEADANPAAVLLRRQFLHWRVIPGGPVHISGGIESLCLHLGWAEGGDAELLRRQLPRRRWLRARLQRLRWR